MQNSNNIDDNHSGSDDHFIKYRKVKANRGAVWLTQGFKLFSSSIAAWFGIATFLFFMLLIPGINTVAALLMPVGIGGLMLGCRLASSGHSFKFEQLFSAIKSDGKELLALSIIYAFASIAIVFVTRYLMLFAGIDVTAALPDNIEQMTNEQLIDWINSQKISDLSPIFLNSLVTLLLMIPLFMAYWFAPALIVLKKMTAINSMKLSFIVCRLNLMPFVIYALVGVTYLALFFLILSIAAFLIPPLAGLALIVGILVIVAVSISSIYTAYVDIFNLQEDDVDFEQNNHSDSSMIA